MHQIKPSHIVFAVRDRDDPNDCAEIGALWPHQDGRGFDATLHVLPPQSTRLVIREAVPADHRNLPTTSQEGERS